MFTLDVLQGTDHLLLRLGGELDLESSPAFRSRLTELVHGANQRTLIDLSDLQFIDSSGLGALVVVLRIPVDDRPRIVVEPSNGPVSRILQATRLDALLDVYPSVEAALASGSRIRSAA